MAPPRQSEATLFGKLALVRRMIVRIPDFFLRGRGCSCKQNIYCCLSSGREKSKRQCRTPAIKRQLVGALGEGAVHAWVTGHSSVCFDADTLCVFCRLCRLNWRYNHLDTKYFIMKHTFFVFACFFVGMCTMNVVNMTFSGESCTIENVSVYSK